MQRYKETLIFIFLAIIGIVFSVMKIYPTVGNLYNTIKQIETKKIEYADLQRQLETLKATELEKDLTLAKKSKKIYKIEDSSLDTESSFAVLFDDFVEMAKFNNIKIYSIEYIYNPPEDTFVKNGGGKYSVCQLNVEIVSDYENISSFLKDIYKFPYLISVEKMELSPYEKNKKIILAKLQVKLFSQK